MPFLSKFVLTVILAVTATSRASASPNLVTNGSFETTSLSGKGNFVGNVAGWSGGSALTFLDFPGTADDGSYLSVYGPFPKTSPNGGKFVEADGDPNYNSTLYQTISGLTVGQKYKLTFDQAAGQQVGFTGATTERWSVGFGADRRLSTEYSLPQGGVGQWAMQTMIFTARSVSELLSFLAVGTPNGAPPISFLDGVSLTEVNVPEPASLGLLGMGMAVAFIGVRSRRRAKLAP